MIDPSSKPSRKVAIADHIWQAFEDMANQMGSDRDALINQAMFMFARLNGFMDSAAPGKSSPGRAQGTGKSAGVSGRSPVASGSMDDDPVRREVQERVLETAAELERLIKAKNQSHGVNIAESPADSSGGQERISDAGVSSSGDAAAGPSLYMMVEGGELDRIAKDRFVIGRGKHCDFVINSGKVSREHAVIVRDGSDFFVEDLGSSNGTWFNKQRIKRRKIEDGDEYFICSEKVKFAYR